MQSQSHRAKQDLVENALDGLVEVAAQKMNSEDVVANVDEPVRVDWEHLREFRIRRRFHEQLDYQIGELLFSVLI